MRRAAVPVVAVLVLVAAGCSGSDGGASAASTTGPPAPTTTAPPLYVPSYAAGPCDGVVPADPRIECGTLTVPVDREAPEAGDVTIAVAIIRSAEPDPLADPVVFFSGGPGAEARGLAAFFLGRNFGGRRDMVLFDQRGTGASTPNLDCPEVVEPIWAALGSPGDALAEAEALGAAVLQCHARLVAAGVDLDAFDTPTTAADAEDLRIALGIEQWNILGLSYGTTVAQEVARSFPAGVRSVVLDSTYATGASNGSDLRVANAARAVDVLIAGCAADAGCAEANGDVRVELQALVDDWNADPYESIIDDPTTGQPRPLVVTGKDLVAHLLNAMYDAELIGTLPSLLAPLREREDAAQRIVEDLVPRSVFLLTGAAEGDTLSVNCADRQRLGGSTAGEAAAFAPLYESFVTLGAVLRCDLWDVESVDATFNEPVVSDLPALVLGNEYDPVTPPAGGEAVAAGFTNGTFVLFPGLGHGALFTDGCPSQILHAFIDTPTAPVDQSCIAAVMGPPRWST